MGKLITLIVYVLMIALGSWAIYEWLVLGKQGVIKAGAFLALLGVCLLWANFLSPGREKR